MPADGQAHAVHGNRVIGAQPCQLRMGQPALSHIVFGVNLKKTNLAGVLPDRGKMFGFETDTGQGGKRIGDHRGGPLKRKPGATKAAPGRIVRP